MGKEADSVLTSTNTGAENQAKYDALIKNFDNYFKGRRNTISKEHHSQRAGESFEQYITDLYELAEFCEFGELMLRDRLVVWHPQPCPIRENAN